MLILTLAVSHNKNINDTYNNSYGANNNIHDNRLSANKEIHYQFNWTLDPIKLVSKSRFYEIKFHFLLQVLCTGNEINISTILFYFHMVLYM